MRGNDAVPIRVRNLKKSFGKTQALKGISFEARRGEIYGLLGHNGAGKTTTFHILLGFYSPTSGEAEMMGCPPGSREVLSHLGFLPEVFFTYDFLTVEETLQFYSRFYPDTEKARGKKIEELMHILGLEEHSQKRVGQLSKGLLRRLGVAHTLLNDPQILILDEPTWGLDPAGAKRVKDLLKKMKEEGKTILLSSHLLTEVELLCDRIGILRNGEMVMEGKMDDLLRVGENCRILFRGGTAETHQRLSSYLLQITFQESEQAYSALLSEENQKSVISLLLKDETAQILSINPEKTTLEEIFVKTVEGML